MEWVPLLIISRGTGCIVAPAAGLVFVFAVTVAFVKRKGQTQVVFSGGDWVTGQPKPLFATLASALLVGI